MGKKRSFFPAFFGIAAVAVVIAFAFDMGLGSTTARQDQPKYSGKEDHLVSLDLAVKYVHNFETKPAVPMIKGGYFGRDIFETILSQKGCVGIRYYYARTDSGDATLVLVGVDSTGNDQIEGAIADKTYPCPPYCPGSSPLSK